MDRAALISALISGGLFNGLWDLDDLSYEPVSLGFIDEARDAWIEGLPEELVTFAEVGVSGKRVKNVKWLPEVFDCDNIARDFGVYISRCMAAKAVRERRPLGNAAVGKLNFQPTPVTGHAVNWFVDHSGQVHTYDAGSRLLDTVTPDLRPTVSNGESI